MLEQVIVLALVIIAFAGVLVRASATSAVHDECEVVTCQYCTRELSLEECKTPYGPERYCCDCATTNMMMSGYTEEDALILYFDGEDDASGC